MAHNCDGRSSNKRGTFLLLRRQTCDACSCTIAVQNTQSKHCLVISYIVTLQKNIIFFNRKHIITIPNHLRYFTLLKSNLAAAESRSSDYIASYCDQLSFIVSKRVYVYCSSQMLWFRQLSTYLSDEIEKCWANQSNHLWFLLIIMFLGTFDDFVENVL